MRKTISHAGLLWRTSLDGDKDLWMFEENVKKLGIVEKFLNIYSYVYIIFLTYLYS